MPVMLRSSSPGSCNGMGALCHHWPLADTDRSPDPIVVAASQSQQNIQIRHQACANGLGVAAQNVALTQHMLRRPAHFSKASTDSCFVAFSISGSQQLEQDGKHATIGPGKACLFSTTRPYVLRNGEPARSVLLEFSMGQIKDRLGRQDCLNTAAINTRVGIGKIAATLCATTASEAAALSETSVFLWATRCFPF